MAVNNDSASWTEDSIVALYRAYQQSRDGVEFRYYRNILDAAREQTREFNAREKMENRMQNIREQAAQMYPADVSGKEQVAEPKKQVANDISGQFSRFMQDLVDQTAAFLQSLNPARLVPVAVAFALFAAVTPFFLNTGGSGTSIVSNQLASLEQYPAQVSTEIGRLGEFHYGFGAHHRDGDTSAAGRYAEAFSSGVILVDIQALNPSSDAVRLTALIGQLQSSPAVDGQLSSAADADLVTRIGAANQAMQAHFDGSDFEPVFLFGQWVESSYLLSRVALDNDDSAILVAALDNLPQLSTMLDQAGYLPAALQRDFEVLAQIKQSDIVSRQEVSRASAILLKLRTLETRPKSGTAG